MRQRSAEADAPLKLTPARSAKTRGRYIRKKTSGDDDAAEPLASSRSGTRGEIDAKGGSPCAVAKATAPPDALEHTLGVSEGTRPIRFAGGEFALVARITEHEPSMAMRQTVSNLALVSTGRPNLQTDTHLAPCLPLPLVALEREAPSEPLNDAGSLGKTALAASRPRDRLLGGRIGVPNTAPRLPVSDPISRARRRRERKAHEGESAAERKKVRDDGRRAKQGSTLLS
jgi:hypothetical protein